MRRVWEATLTVLAVAALYGIVVVLSMVGDRQHSGYYYENGHVELTDNGESACVIDDDGYAHCAPLRNLPR